MELSPLTRGTEAPTLRLWPHKGIIPADAGNGLGRLYGWEKSGNYPR